MTGRYTVHVRCGAVTQNAYAADSAPRSPVIESSVRIFVVDHVFESVPHHDGITVIVDRSVDVDRIAD